MPTYTLKKRVNINSNEVDVIHSKERGEDKKKI